MLTKNGVIEKLNDKLNKIENKTNGKSECEDQKQYPNFQ